MIRRRLAVTGRVQNVFYRDWFVERARGFGLDGWIRNRADGSVEAVVQGPAEMVAAMIASARDGPPAARVAEVVESDDTPAETLHGFEKRATL